ncbi:pentapeptide repeat-containing protein [Bdellovibrionota bacterium FG-2]
MTNADFTGATVGDNLGEVGSERRVIQLSGTTLDVTKLAGLDLSHCDLSGAMISSSLFSSTALDDAEVAEVSGDIATVLSQAASFMRVDLSGMDLTGADFSGNPGKDLTTVILDLTNLSGVNFTNATPPPTILLGYDGDDGVLFTYDPLQSVSANKTQFNALLNRISSDPKVQVTSSTLWIDGSAVR